jgi:selenophosphate synthetase-related protein
MRLERGDRVIFTKDVGGFLRPSVPKGTEATVTKAGWGVNVEVTLENGTKLTVSRNEVTKINRKRSRKGDRVIFTKAAGGILRPSVPKGTEATVTKAGGWGSQTEVTLRNGTKLTVSRNEVSKIDRWKSWW